MHRRSFLKSAVGAGMAAAVSVMSKSIEGEESAVVKPMALGLLIKPARGPEQTFARVRELGFSTCFLSLDDYIGKFTPELASQFRELLHKNELTPTAAEVVGPGTPKWNFLDGPSTIGVVPRATRAARMGALKQTSDFAQRLNIPNVQTHCGFIPENPRDPLYEETVKAIAELADYCAGNGQHFLMETGQETPTTMLRTIKDASRPNLGVGLDTANLILYGKANPVDAVELIGPYVRSIHAKDGKWPTDPERLGEEVVIGRGIVDFAGVFTKLKKLGYTGAVTIERETSGPQQIEDVKAEKIYLERVLTQIGVSAA